MPADKALLKRRALETVAMLLIGDGLLGVAAHPS